MNGHMFRLCLQSSSVIFRPTCSTDQVKMLRVREAFVPNLYYNCTTSWPEDDCKHNRNMSPYIN